MEAYRLDAFTIHWMTILFSIIVKVSTHGWCDPISQSLFHTLTAGDISRLPRHHIGHLFSLI